MGFTAKVYNIFPGMYISTENLNYSVMILKIKKLFRSKQNFILLFLPKNTPNNHERLYS